MAPSFLSVANLYTAFLRRCFDQAGLAQQALDVDDQTTIHFWAPKIKDATKPNLVFIHGFGPVAIWQWRQQVQHMAPHFNVYVPDLIFFGESTTTSTERSEVFQAESVGKLLAKLSVDRYSVVGTSYGGFVSYHLARAHPDKVEKVVIASSGINMRRRDNEELIKRANLDTVSDLMLPQTAPQMRALLGLAAFRKLRGVPDFVFNDFISKLYAENRDRKLELLKGLTLGQDDSVNISPLDQQDVLIIWGDKDQIFPLKMAYELKGLLGKDVKLEIIKNASHVPQIERAQQFNNILKNFLLGSSSSQSSL